MVASCYYFFTLRIINTFKLIMLFKRATRRLLELSKPNMRHLTESLVPALMIFNKRSNKLRQRPPLFIIHMIALITVRGLSDGRPTFTQLLNKNFILLHCLSITSFKLILSKNPLCFLFTRIYQQPLRSFLRSMYRCKSECRNLDKKYRART